MSDTFYPIALTAKQRQTWFNRVVVDEFEAGNTMARRMWEDKYFKRRFEIEHAPLTRAEFKTLRSFVQARNGGYDSFWYRDNVTRGGNAKVRFAVAPPSLVEKQVIGVNVVLEEVDAFRSLPELDEVTAAAGIAPLAWYDANRQLYYEHMGTGYLEKNAAGTEIIHDHATAETYPLVMQAGSNPLSNKFSQYQYWRATGTSWAKTGSNIAAITGTQPALTWFLVMRFALVSASGVLVSVGSSASQGAFGVALEVTTNKVGIWTGAAMTTGASTHSSWANTWQSLAIGVDTGSNSVRLWQDAANIEDITATRSHAAGPISLLAAAGGANICAADATADIAHAILFPSKLTTGKVEDLHNLFAHQVGYVEV